MILEKLKKKNMYTILGGAMVFIVIFVAVLNLFWTPADPTRMNAAERFAAPSAAHPFGTDNFGRDILSRVMNGVGQTILISSLVMVISSSCGVLIGAVAGYNGGWFDDLIMRITDAINGFPSILLALVVISVLGPGRKNLIISLGIAFIPSFVRIVRGEFIRLRDADYILRARLMGVSRPRILFVHILPNIFSTFWVAVMIGFNNAILAESGMSYLGIGTAPPDATLGNMLSDAQGYLTRAPWYAIFSGLSIVFIVLGASLLSEGLRRKEAGRGAGDLSGRQRRRTSAGGRALSQTASSSILPAKG